MPLPDITVNNCGNIIQITPHSAEADRALSLVDTEPWMWLGRTLCVDQHMALDLLDHLSNEGLSIQHAR